MDLKEASFKEFFLKDSFKEKKFQKLCFLLKKRKKVSSFGPFS